MTRSKERLRAGTRPTGPWLRRYVVTENVTRALPVSHEKARVEWEPITEATGQRGRRDIRTGTSARPSEVTLHWGPPVIGKETVLARQVRMDTDAVSEQETVDESVRNKQIEVEGYPAAPVRSVVGSLCDQP